MHDLTRAIGSLHPLGLGHAVSRPSGRQHNAQTAFVCRSLAHWDHDERRCQNPAFVSAGRNRTLWLGAYIRALGVLAPGSYAAFGRLASVPDTDAAPNALEMVRLLVEAHETVIRTAREVVRAAEDAGDQATADLGTQRLQLHERTAWMLRSLLED